MEEVRAHCKPHEITTVKGDLNAKIGCGREANQVGDFVLGMRNNNGDGWLE